MIADDYLVVFDNVSSIESIKEYIPHSAHGSIIITTRNEIVTGDLVETNLRVASLSTEHGAELFLHLLASEPLPESIEIAREVSETFDGLPLAIGMVAGYCKVNQCSADHFLSLYAHHKSQSNAPRHSGANICERLSRLWDVSLSCLASEPRQVLHKMALLDPDSVPEDLFCNAQGRDELELYEKCLFNDLLVELRRQSLISKNPFHHTISMHRFLRDSIFDQLCRDKDQLRSTFADCLDLLEAVFPNFSRDYHWAPDQWSCAQRYATSVVAIEQRFHAESMKLKGFETQLARLVFNCGVYVILTPY